MCGGILGGSSPPAPQPVATPTQAQGDSDNAAKEAAEKARLAAARAQGRASFINQQTGWLGIADPLPSTKGDSLF